jgi:hypothetical protein
MLEIKLIRNYDEFSYIESSLRCFHEINIVRKWLLNKLQKNTRRQQKVRKLIRMTQLNMKDQGFRYFLPVVTGLGSMNRKCDDMVLRGHHLDAMGVLTSLQFVFLAGCTCIGLC